MSSIRSPENRETRPSASGWYPANRYGGLDESVNKRKWALAPYRVANHFLSHPSASAKTWRILVW